MTKNKHNRDSIIICGLFYFAVLCIAYRLFVGKYYGYAGFASVFDIGRMILSLVICVLILWKIDIREKQLSSFFLGIQYILIFCPMAVYFIFNPSADLTYYLIVTLSFALQIIILNKVDYSMRENVKYSSRNSDILIVSLLLFCGIIVVLSIVQVGMPTFKAFNLSKVYEIRRSNETPLYLSYTINWSAKVILPFTFIYSMDKGRYGEAVVSIMFIILLYMIYAFKAFLLIPVAIFIIYLLSRKKCLIKSLYILAPTAIALILVIFLINNKLMLPSLFIRRMLFVPSQLKFEYYNFFSRNQLVYFADGMVGRVFGIESPYDLGIPKVIAAYLGEPDTNANTGYFGDLYANAGFVGVIIGSGLLAYMVKWLAKLGRDMTPSVVIASLTITFMSLNDAAFLTNILTGGMFLFFILFSLVSYFSKDRGREVSLDGAAFDK